MADAVDPTEGSMSLLDHLTELRNRIGIVFIAFVVIFLACFIRPFGSGSANIADLTYHWLQAPLAAREEVSRMIFTGLHEGFFTQVKVAFFVLPFLLSCCKSGVLLRRVYTKMNAERFILSC